MDKEGAVLWIVYISMIALAILLIVMFLGGI